MQTKQGKQMNILIASVGNINRNCIKVLAQELNKKHKVTIISMASYSSHRGLAFSFRDIPVRVNPVMYKDIVKNSAWICGKDPKQLAAFDGIAAYEFDSNPADAIAVMLCDIIAHKKPDLVICGISNGVHMGQDIYCSSNIGMAMEATFFDIPAIAVAVEQKFGGHSEQSVANAAQFIVKNVDAFAKLKLPKHTFLNINIPTVEKYKDFKGVKVAKMGHMTPLSLYVERVDGNGGKYYWADNVTRVGITEGEEYARPWFDKGWITVVPLNYDATDYDAVKDWNNDVIKNIRKDEKGGSK